MRGIIEQIPAPLKRGFGGLQLWQWAALALLAGLGVLVSRLLYALIAASAKRHDGWRRQVARAVAAPSAALATALCLLFLYPELRLPAGAARVCDQIAHLLAIFAVAWAAYRGAEVLAARLSEQAGKNHAKLDSQLVPIVRKAVKVAVLMLGAMAMLESLGVNATALLGTLGIGTLAVGLAAKDTLANLFGSLSIFVDNPFKIGDWIHVEGVDGVVEEVGLRSTRLRTFYDSLVVIPNAKIADAKIDNYGQRRLLRVQLSLRLLFGTAADKAEALCAALRERLRERAHVARDKTEVWLAGSGAALEISVTVFFVPSAELNESQEKHEILLAVLRLCGEMSVPLAGPED